MGDRLSEARMAVGLPGVAIDLSALLDA
jgi:hypothetical protein